MSSNIISRKLCFCWKRREIGRPSGHSNRGQRRHVHIRRHAVVRRGKRETEKKREKGIVNDVVRWDKLAAVSFETTPWGPTATCYTAWTKKGDTYLPIPRALPAPQLEPKTRPADQMHSVFHHLSVYVCAITVFFYSSIHYVLLS